MKDSKGRCEKGSRREQLGKKEEKCEKRRRRRKKGLREREDGKD